MTDTVYTQMLVDAGIPTTKEGLQTEWDRLNDESDVKIANDSAWSPFWRLISTIATTPALWLVNLLITYALPNTFLKHAQGIWLDLLAWAVYIERKLATKTRGSFKFTKIEAANDTTIDAGILIATPEINGKIYRMITTEAVTIPNGTVSALVSVEAEFAGTAYNLGPGYYSVLPEPIDNIESVVNETDWITISGADEESDDALRIRSRNQFSAVGQYHHDAAYRADIAMFAGIRTDYIWFEHGAPRGPGTANAFIMIDSGVPPQEFVDGINAYIVDQGHHGHGDDMLSMVMPGTPQDMTITVYHNDTLSDEDKDALEAGVTNRVRYAFRENQDFKDITRTMPFKRFSFSQLDRELHTQLPNLKSVEFSINDLVSGMELFTLNNLVVNMEIA